MEVEVFLNLKNLHNHEVCSLREFCPKIDVDMLELDQILEDVVTIDKGFTPLSWAKRTDVGLHYRGYVKFISLI